MEIIINSLYTQKDIFLRELVSNAVDANDKIRFMSIADPALSDLNPELNIKISFNEAESQVIVQDTGVGMSKDDLISNLGTLAKSGTTAFLEQIQAGNMNLIGQFGVGFYSAFLVADKVEVVTRRFGHPAYRWTSAASNEFYIEDVEEDVDYGTKVICHLKEEAQKYANATRLKKIIQKFSQFTNFPIYLFEEVTHTEQVDMTEEEIENRIQMEEEKDEEERDYDFPRTKDHTYTVNEWVQQNTNKAIWLRDKDELKEEDYVEFY